MTYLMQNLGRIDYVMNGWDPAIYDPDYEKFLMGVDFETDDQTRVAVWTDDRAQAIHFRDQVEVFDTWRCVDPHHPVRLDGEPNRPLTLWSITVQEAR